MKPFIRLIKLLLPVTAIFCASCADDDSQNFLNHDSANDPIPESSETIEPIGPVWDEPLTDSRDSKTYKTVIIGDQTWMAENLAYETENSFGYDDSVANREKYGRLYTWDAAMSACPSGWHLPEHDEIKFHFFRIIKGGQDSAGIALKATTDWDEDIRGTDIYGFSAYPTGIRDARGTIFMFQQALFWTSTDSDSSGTKAFYMLLDNEADAGLYGSYYKTYGMSVRCVKGAPWKYTN